MFVFTQRFFGALSLRNVFDHDQKVTRFACIIQIPIVLAAVFLTGIFQEAINAMVWPSVVALALLSLFTVIGSGPWSLDRYLAGWGDV